MLRFLPSRFSQIPRVFPSVLASLAWTTRRPVGTLVSCRSGRYARRSWSKTQGSVDDPTEQSTFPVTTVTKRTQRFLNEKGKHRDTSTIYGYREASATGGERKPQAQPKARDAAAGSANCHGAYATAGGALILRAPTAHASLTNPGSCTYYRIHNEGYWHTNLCVQGPYYGSNGKYYTFTASCWVTSAYWSRSEVRLPKL